MKEGAQAGSGFPDLTETSNVMLFAPDEDDRIPCFEPLAEAHPQERQVLVVSYTRQPAAVVDAWETQVGDLPATGGIVTVGQPETGFESPDWEVTRVESPGDLTGTGIELSTRLSGLADTAGVDAEVVVCFESVTELLGHTDVQRVFRFLHVLTGRVRNAGARCYYRFDPAAHDEQTIATLQTLFDGSVERDDRGWTVRR